MRGIGLWRRGKTVKSRSEASVCYAILVRDFAYSLVRTPIDLQGLGSLSGIELLKAQSDFLTQSLSRLKKSKSFRKDIALTQEASFGNHPLHERRQVGWDFCVHRGVALYLIQTSMMGKRSLPFSEESIPGTIISIWP